MAFIKIRTSCNIRGILKSSVSCKYWKCLIHQNRSTFLGMEQNWEIYISYHQEFFWNPVKWKISVEDSGVYCVDWFKLHQTSVSIAFLLPASHQWFHHVTLASDYQLTEGGSDNPTIATNHNHTITNYHITSNTLPPMISPRYSCSDYQLTDIGWQW